MAVNSGRLRYLLGARRKPVLYLHVGMHKTGTTSIQAAMFSSRRQLERRGICYPAFAQNHSVALKSLFCEKPEKYLQNIRKGRSSGEQVAEFNAGIAGQLRRILTRESWRKVLISGEAIGTLGPAGVERLKRFFDGMVADYRIIFYIRPPASYINSAAQERVKGGEKLPEFVTEQSSPRYRKRLEPFLESFGRDSIELRLYDPTAMRGGLLQDFCTALDEPDLVDGVSAGVRNRSWSENAVRIMDAYNSRYPLLVNGPDGSLVMNPERPSDSVVRDVLQYVPGRSFRLAREALDLLLDACREDIAWMESVFGNRIDDRAGCPAATGTEACGGEIAEEEFADIAELLHGLGRHANTSPGKAESFCDRLIERFENNPGLWLQKGSALRGQSNLHGAEAALEKALEIDPEHIRAWNKLAIVRQARGDLQGARAAARKSISLSPETDAFRARLVIINRLAWLRLPMNILARARSIRLK